MRKRLRLLRERKRTLRQVGRQRLRLFHGKRGFKLLSFASDARQLLRMTVREVQQAMRLLGIHQPEGHFDHSPPERTVRYTWEEAFVSMLHRLADTARLEATLREVTPHRQSPGHLSGVFNDMLHWLDEHWAKPAFTKAVAHQLLRKRAGVWSHAVQRKTGHAGFVGFIDGTCKEVARPGGDPVWQWVRCAGGVYFALPFYLLVP